MLKPTDHIVLFVEDNPGVRKIYDSLLIEMLRIFCKCDQVYFVQNELPRVDHAEVFNGTMVRMMIALPEYVHIV